MLIIGPCTDPENSVRGVGGPDNVIFVSAFSYQHTLSGH